MKTVLNHLSLSDYRDLALMLLDIKDSLHERRVDSLLNGLATVTDSYTPPATATGYNYNNNYVTEQEKGEAIALMSKVVLSDKEGIAVGKVYSLRDKWLSPCLVSNLDPYVRETSLQLLLCCISSAPSAEDKDTRFCECLESLMKLTPVASRSIIPPIRVANIEYHKNYDWRLLEYAYAVKACLVGEKQRQIFGKYIVKYAELLENVDKNRREGDKSKWALLEALLEGVKDTPNNLAKLLESKIFVDGLRGWCIAPNSDSDNEVALFCELLVKLAKSNQEFLIDYVGDSPVLFWLLVFIAPLKDRFPQSSELITSLVLFCLHSPEVSPHFTQSLFHSALSQLEWREMLARVDLIARLKQENAEVMSGVFWTGDMVKETIGCLRSSHECFLPLCVFVALFADTCPDVYKTHIVRIILSSHNCFVNTLSDCDLPPSTDELAFMENNLEKILNACCSTWYPAAMYLFNAFVNCLSGKEPLQIAMIVNSTAVDRVVRRIFEQGMAAIDTIPEDTRGQAKSVLFGMSLAYIVVCSRGMQSLPQFIRDVRSHLALGPSDPELYFGAENIASALLSTIETPALSDEAESLLSACFAKTAPFVLNDDLLSLLAEAVRYISDSAGLQKMFILCHSTQLAPYLEQYLDALAANLGAQSDKYIAAIRKIEHPQHPVQQQQPQEPQPQESQPQPQLVVEEEVREAKLTSKQPEDDEKDEQQQPIGLPPSTSDDESTEMK